MQLRWYKRDCGNVDVVECVLCGDVSVGVVMVGVY